MTNVPVGRMDHGSGARLNPRQARLFVLVVALTVFAAKLWMATHTFGTEDVRTFMNFAQGVRERGPVGVYSIDYRAAAAHLPYNHPPLIGYFLQLANTLSDWGIPLRVTLRAASSAADVISGLLVYEILRRRTSVNKAVFAGVAVAASPLLFLVSGYHGNTDPIFLMFALLGSFLIIDESMGLWGGVALGLSVGVKIVAVVAIPVLAVYLVRHCRKALPGAAAGFGVTLAITWGPAVVKEWTPLRRNVLGYTGIGSHPWGIVRLSDEAGWPSFARFLTGPGTHLIVLICALLPALLTWHARSKAMDSVALSFVGTLVFLPGYAIQYMSWAVAAAYLLDVFSATIYNVLGGLVVFHVYNYWNFGVWTQPANARRMTASTLGLLALLWAALVAVLITGVRRTLSAKDDPMPEPLPRQIGRPASTVRD